MSRRLAIANEGIFLVVCGLIPIMITMKLIPIYTISALATSSLFAASLTQNTSLLRSGTGEPVNALDISVFDGAAAYAYDDGTTSTSTVTMGDGTLEDYAFFGVTSDAYASYATGSGSIITSVADGGSATVSGSNSLVELWESTNPDNGTGDFSSVADFTSGTMGRSADVSGTLDLSGYASGTIYFFFGTFFDVNSVSATLSGAGQTNIVTSTGDLSEGGTNAFYVASFDFVTDGVYDSLTFQYTNADADGSRARFAGLTVDAVAIPEAGSFALIAGILGFGAVSIRRRR